MTLRVEGEACGVVASGVLGCGGGASGTSLDEFLYVTGTVCRTCLAVFTSILQSGIKVIIEHYIAGFRHPTLIYLKFTKIAKNCQKKHIEFL